MEENYSKCDCVCCRDNHDFEINPDLFEDFLNSKVAIFAGSGISTESRKVLKFTFYEDIAAEIGKPNSALSFPKLMDKYCQQPNGRIKLLEKIKDRLSHIKSFPELEREANKFHSPPVSAVFVPP